MPLQWEEPKVEEDVEALATETIVLSMTKAERELCRQVIRDLIRDDVLLRGLGPSQASMMMGAPVTLKEKQAALASLNRSLYS